MTVLVQIVNESNNPLPKYQTAGAAGMDIQAYLPDGPIEIAPGERALIGTGIKVSIPSGFEIQVRSRSGMALKKGVTVANAPGTIDEDYRGEVGVIMINHGTETITVNSGDRVAQIVLQKVPRIEWSLTDMLSDTERGEGGFGSTKTLGRG